MKSQGIAKFPNFFWDHKCDTAIQSTVAKTFHHDVNPMVAIEQNKINELYLLGMIHFSATFHGNPYNSLNVSVWTTVVDRLKDQHCHP